MQDLSFINTGNAFSNISAFTAVKFKLKPVPKLRQAALTMAYSSLNSRYVLLFRSEFQQKINHFTSDGSNYWYERTFWTHVKTCMCLDKIPLI